MASTCLAIETYNRKTQHIISAKVAAMISYDAQVGKDWELPAPGSLCSLKGRLPAEYRRPLASLYLGRTAFQTAK